MTAEVLAVEQFQTRPRDVEAVRWDCAAATAPTIIAWIESKGEKAELVLAGSTRPHAEPWEKPYVRNFIAIRTDEHGLSYRNAQESSPWIVWEEDRYDWSPEEGNFDLCTDDEMAKRYRRHV